MGGSVRDAAAGTAASGDLWLGSEWTMFNSGHVAPLAPCRLRDVTSVSEPFIFQGRALMTGSWA